MTTSPRSIKTYTIDTNNLLEVRKTEGLLVPEVQAAVNRELPVTLILAACGSQAAGALAGAMDKGAFSIESLYVVPEFRRQGIGTALIEHLRRIIMSEEIMIRADYTSGSPETETLSSFFRHTGFSRDRVDLPMFYISSLAEMALEGQEKNKNLFQQFIKTFDEVKDDVLKKASIYAKTEFFPLPEGGLLSERIDRSISCCVLKDERIMAYLAIEKEEMDLVKIPALWSALPDPRIVIAMLKKSAMGLKGKYPPETRASMIAINSASEKIILHLFPNAKACSYSFISI